MPLKIWWTLTMVAQLNLRSEKQRKPDFQWCHYSLRRFQNDERNFEELVLFQNQNQKDTSNVRQFSTSEYRHWAVRTSSGSGLVSILISRSGSRSLDLPPSVFYSVFLAVLYTRGDMETSAAVGNIDGQEAGKERIGHTEPWILLTRGCSSKVRRQCGQE